MNTIGDVYFQLFDNAVPVIFLVALAALTLIVLRRWRHSTGESVSSYNEGKQRKYTLGTLILVFSWVIILIVEGVTGAAYPVQIIFPLDVFALLVFAMLADKDDSWSANVAILHGFMCLIHMGWIAAATLNLSVQSWWLVALRQWFLMMCIAITAAAAMGVSAAGFLDRLYRFRSLVPGQPASAVPALQRFVRPKQTTGQKNRAK